MKKRLSLVMLIVICFGIIGFAVRFSVVLGFFDKNDFSATIFALADISIALSIVQGLALAVYDLFK